MKNKNLSVCKGCYHLTQLHFVQTLLIKFREESEENITKLTRCICSDSEGSSGLNIVALSEHFKNDNNVYAGIYLCIFFFCSHNIGKGNLGIINGN